MRNKEHAALALLIAIPLHHIGVSLDSLIAFYLSGFLPDILEPPFYYTHRKKLHSKRALKVTGIVGLIGFVMGLATGSYFWPFFVFLGYALHLLGDSLTPMGLPP